MPETCEDNALEVTDPQVPADAAAVQARRYQSQRFAAPATADGDPIHERFNDDELRMLGPLLRREFATTEPPVGILDQLPNKGFDRARVLRTAAEFCMYRGWLTLGAEASRRAQFPGTLELWAGFLDEEQRPEEAAEIRKLIDETLSSDS